MLLFYLKSVLWRDVRYERPTGMQCIMGQRAKDILAYSESSSKYFRRVVSAKQQFFTALPAGNEHYRLRKEKTLCQRNALFSKLNPPDAKLHSPHSQVMRQETKFGLVVGCFKYNKVVN